MSWLSDFFKDLYEKLVETFKGWMQEIVDSIKWIIESITDVIKTTVNFCLDLIWDFGSWLYDLFLGEEGFIWYPFDWVLGFGEMFLGVFPDMSEFLDKYSREFGMVMNLVTPLDSFFPVSETFIFLGIYLVFVSTLIVIRLALKCFPGMGG